MKVNKTEYRDGQFHSTRDQFASTGSPIELLFRDSATNRVTLTRYLDGPGGPMQESVVYIRLSAPKVQVATEDAPDANSVFEAFPFDDPDAEINGGDVVDYLGEIYRAR